MYIYLINPIVLLFFHFFYYKNKNHPSEKYIWVFVIFLLTIFIGFRNEIGADWKIYENYFYDIENITIKENILSSSAVYLLINKIVYYAGIKFWGVNVLCASIFMLALSLFLQDSKNKWLGLLFSFPIIIVIIGMGYIRQGLAFSFILLLIKSLENRNLLNAFIFIILSIFSHKSALFISSFLLFINFFYYKNIFYVILSFFITISFLFLFLFNYKHLIYFYIGEGQHMFSYGSFPRGILISVVAISFLFLKKKFINMSDYQVYIYSYFSYFILILFPFSFSASIMADRLLLYFYPLKLVFILFANLNDKKIIFLIFSIISSYFFYFITWISFGVNASGWIPYKFIGF